ncbi:MAG: hypothetical protein AAF497_25125 [Planctomycetota bacterium]
MTTFEIRQHISLALLQFGADPALPLKESLLIREGIYCGQRFKRGAYQAVWFVDEDQIKFSGPNGETLEIIAASEIQPQPATQQRSAA